MSWFGLSERCARQLSVFIVQLVSAQTVYAPHCIASTVRCFLPPPETAVASNVRPLSPEQVIYKNKKKRK